MNFSYKLRTNMAWFTTSILFFKNHFAIIILLALIAAFGRAVQLGAFGKVSPVTNTILEIIVECSRILVFLYALGLTNLKTGALRVVQLFTRKANRKQNWSTALQTLKRRWRSVLLNITAFLLFAFLINYLINYTAYQTCLYYKLKAGNILSDGASEWVLLLFFKNISVIPFTLIFNATFLLWITNKLKVPPVHKAQ